ncbi:MAG: hypothetical protein M3371_12490 [Acidobacteriota bacterium]|nr:hypothetical protein [Acidobacteriota bacterium]
MNYFNYYTEIEDTFIRRRGKHLLLSPLDWALIESWKEKGVPLHVALRGIEGSFDSFEAKPRRRTVKSLFYCQEEVEAQFAEWLESQRGAAIGAAATNGDRSGPLSEHTAETAGLPFPREVILAHLDDCCATLRCAAASDDAGRAGDLGEALERAAARLTVLREDFARAVRPDAEQLEGALTDLEKLLDHASRAQLAPERLAELRVQAAAQLRPYRARMERATYEQTLEHLLAKLLREERGLPRLSLFYL